MLQTYKAVLNGDHVEWVDEPPRRNHPIPIHITVLDDNEAVSTGERGRRMAEALENIANHGGLSRIPDPVEWQRHVRSDRTLPDRD